MAMYLGSTRDIAIRDSRSRKSLRDLEKDAIWLAIRDLGCQRDLGNERDPSFAIRDLENERDLELSCDCIFCIQCIAIHLPQLSIFLATGWTDPEPSGP